MTVTEMVDLADTAMLATLVIACFLCVVLLFGACLTACYAEIQTTTDPTARLIAAVAATFIVVVMIAGAIVLIGAIIDDGWVAVLRAGK